MKKRMLTMLLALILIVSVIPFAASAATLECGHSTGSNLKALTGYETYKAATCDQDGQTMVYKCKACETGTPYRASYYVAVSGGGYEYHSSATEAKAAAVLPKGHKFVDGACTECGATNNCAHNNHTRIARASEPTCTVDGAYYDIYKCDDCGVTWYTNGGRFYTDDLSNVIRPASHDYGSGVDCTVCGQRKPGVPACDHDDISGNGPWAPVNGFNPGKEASCEEDGYLPIYKCGICGVYGSLRESGVVTYSSLDEAKAALTSPATGHSYKQGVCTDCGDCKNNHKNTEVIPATEATCTRSARTEGEKCSVCGYVTKEPQIITGTYLGHDTESKVVKEATCVEAGEMEITCKRADCNYKDTEEIPINPEAHKVVEVAGQDATCTATGWTAGEQCELCKAVLKYRIATETLEHDFQFVKDTIENSCKRDGQKLYKCSVCGEEKREKVKALPHTIVDVEAVPATCTEAGATAGKMCSVCDATLEGRDVIAPLGHSYSNDSAYLVNTIREPSCKVKNEVGRGEFKCTRCDETDYLNIPCVDCKFVDVAGVEPTCTATGWTAGKKCESCGTVSEYRYEIKALGHDFENGKVTITREATCDKYGLKYTTCSRCDAKTEVETFAKLPHNLTSKVLKEATCTKTGSKKIWCADCDLTPVYETIPVLGHTEVDIEPTAATCAAQATKDGKKCSVCGEITVEPVAYGAKLNHDMQLIATYEKPTCTESGWGRYDCTGCGYAYDAVIEPAGHTVVEVEAIPATCTEAGATAGKWCSVCEATLEGCDEVPALGHDITANMAYLKEMITEPTCETEGKGKFRCSRGCKSVWSILTIPAVDHEYVVNEGVAPTCVDTGWTAGEWCKYCHEKSVKTYREEIPALGHDFSVEFKVVKAPTCTKAGSTVFKCSRCEGYAELPVEAKGHEFEELLRSDATCTQIGRVGKECKICKHQEISPIDATGHTEEIMPAVEATCTATGLTEGKKCATCNAVLTAQEEVAMIDHTWVEKTGVSATCTTDGYTAYKECSVCGLTEGKEVIPAAHTFVEGSYKCTVCDAADPMCEHENGKIETVASTCTVAGTETFTCDDCGYQFVETLEKAAHEIEVQNTAATCTAPGETRKVCTVCNQVLERIEIPMVAHRFADGACTVCGTLDSNSSTTQPGSGNTGNTGDSGSTGNSGNAGNAGTSGCSHDKSTVTNPATCTTAGYEMVTCATCNKVVSKTLLPALGHTNNTQITEPTCTKNGVKIVTCDRCDKFDYEVLPATGRHNYVNGICSSCNGTDPSRYTKDFQDVQIVGGPAY